VKAVTIGMRVGSDIAASIAITGRVHIGGVTVRSVTSNPVPTSPTTVSSAGAPLTFAQLVALQWEVFCSFIAHDGVIASCYEFWLDVEWYPVQGGGSLYVAD